MGRTVEDAAFLLSAMAGPDPRSPVSIAEAGSVFLKSLKRHFKKTRIAWSRDLGGLPVEPSVTAVLEKHRKTFAELGCSIEDAEPDFSGATEAFETLRAVGFATKLGPVMRDHRNKLKGTVIPPSGEWAYGYGERPFGPEVRLTLRTDDDQLIFMQYRGVIDSGVNPTYWRTVPWFEAGTGKYSWLNNRINVGVGHFPPGTTRVAEYRIYQIV